MKKGKVNCNHTAGCTIAWKMSLPGSNRCKGLLVFTLFCIITINNVLAQCTSCTYNMSFERAAGGCFGQSFAPNTNTCLPDAISEKWTQCGSPYIPSSWGCGSADIGPGGSINATTKPPTHGNSYLSMECGPAGEGVDMELCAGGNLVAGTTYCFSIDINCKGTTGNITMYGSMGLCGATQALWVSPDHSGDNWVTNNFCITPTGNWTHIQFRNTKGSGFYAIAIDNWKSTDGKFPPVSGTPPVVTVPSATICAGASATLAAAGATTYTWSPATGLSANTGTSVTASPAVTTTYTVTGTTSGCTATATALVTVNPVPVISVSGASICPGASSPLTASGADTYTWAPATGLSAATGATVTASPVATTTYTVTGTSADGCTGSATVLLTVTPPCGPVVNATGVTVCAGECGAVTSTATGGTPPYTYLWNTGATTSGMTPAVCPASTTSYTLIISDNSVPAGTASAIAVITVNPNPVVTVPAATVCAGSAVVLTASGADTYTWSPATDLSSGTGTSVTATPATTGTYTVCGTANGCSACTSVVITVDPVPVVSVPDASICPGGATPLTASGATTYTWLPATGLSATTGATVTAGPAVTTTYTVCGTTGACSSCTTVTVTVGALVATVSPDVAVCFGGSTSLIAGGGSSYSWAPATGLSNTTFSNPVATPAVTTTYTVVVSDGSCSDDAVVVVTVDPAPVINVPGAAICKGTSVLLSATGASSYAWSPAGAGLSAASGSSVIASPGVTTTYTVTGTSSSGCTGTVEVVVVVNEAPLISSAPAAICPGEDTTLVVSGAAFYSWSPPDFLSATTGAMVTARPASTTTYTVVGTAVNGCTSVATVVVTVHPKPVADFTTGPEEADEFDATVYFNDLSTGGTITSWSWSFGDPKNSGSVFQNPSFTYPGTADQYPVKLVVTNEFGCMDSTVAPVDIRGIFTFYIPNAFTPNGDGINDGFLPRGVGIDETDYDLWIFDRWGNLIWHTETWGEAWDGRANSGADIAQMDTYVWKVHVREKETSSKHNYVGHVNIVK